MKMVRVLFLLAVIALTAMPAQARQAVGVHEKVVNGFMYLVDNSGSMMLDHASTGVQKIEMAKRIMTKVDSHVPELGYQAALALFAPNAVVIPATTWEHYTFVSAIQNIGNDAPVFGRLTSMASSFEALAGAVSEVPGPKAVYLISDGMDNLGASPVAAAQALYAANPDMVLHIISLADCPEGVANLKAIAALNSYSCYIDGRIILDSDVAAKDLVSNTLYIETIPSDAVTSLHEVLFNVGKYDILPKYAKMLDEMAAIMVTRPDLKFYIEGFADPSGNATSNLTLSENRANAVKDYLINAGVREGQLISKGRGEIDDYPSYMLDRRVEIMIIWE